MAEKLAHSLRRQGTSYTKITAALKKAGFLTKAGKYAGVGAVYNLFFYDWKTQSAIPEFTQATLGRAGIAVRRDHSARVRRNKRVRQQRLLPGPALVADAVRPALEKKLNALRSICGLPTTDQDKLGLIELVLDV